LKVHLSSDSNLITTHPHPQVIPILPPGTILKAFIAQKITASSTVPTPVRARILKGRYKGAFALGYAKLDGELKRVLIDFHSLYFPWRRKQSNYKIKGQALSPTGEIGLTGKFITHEGKFFLAELATATVAGLLDATKERSRNVLGQYEESPSVGNVAKSGAVTALTKTTGRMAERARSAPQYTVVESNQMIQLMITSE